jgi:hypothetical protein
MVVMTMGDQDVPKRSELGDPTEVFLVEGTGIDHRGVLGAGRAQDPRVGAVQGHRTWIRRTQQRHPVRQRVDRRDSPHAAMLRRQAPET